MKQNWSKADAKKLLKGNPQKIRRWIRDYADIVYTWILYHYPENSAEAKERTIHIFQDSCNQISTYDPTASSMYIWLVDGARRLYPLGQQYELHMFRGAEDQVSPDDIHALMMIGSVDLPETILELPVVARLIQAALTDMDEPHRLALLRRYHRIDSTAGLAFDSKVSSDSVPDQLVRARYYFRRYLFSWIHALYPETGEFVSDSRIETFEKNLEKIFHSISPAVKLPQEFLDDLEKTILQQAEQTQYARQSERKPVPYKAIGFAAGISLFLIAAIVVVVFTGKEQALISTDSSIRESSDSESESKSEEPVEEEMTSEMLRESLNQVLEAGSEGDTEALILALEEGSYPAQIAAAIFLGRIGDQTAINPLEKAARQWYPNELEENPFLAAIEQIEYRISQEAEQAADEGMVEEIEIETEPMEMKKHEAIVDSNSSSLDPNLAGVGLVNIRELMDVNEIAIDAYGIRKVEDPNIYELAGESFEPNVFLPAIEDSNFVDVEVIEDNY